MDFSLREERVNLPVYNRVFGLASERIMALAGLGPHQQLSVAVTRSIDSRIRNRFDNARRRARRAALPEYQRLEIDRENARRRRLQRVSKEFNSLMIITHLLSFVLEIRCSQGSL